MLVLGGPGFIGRWVARLLTRAGAELYVPARDCRNAKRTFAEFDVRGEILKLDLRDTGIVDRMISEIDPAITFNLAGYGIDRSECSEELAHQINAVLPEILCRTVAKSSTRANWSGQRFVHVGTAMEYGDVRGDLRESSPTRPTTVYGRSKLAGTEAVASVCRENSLAGLTARLFAVYGPGESHARLLPMLNEASRTTGPIDLTAGLHRRDFTYVEDVAEALLRLGRAECRPGEVVNVATGTLSSIRSLVEIASRKIGVTNGRLDFGSLPTRPEEMDHDPVNVDRLLELTGWKPGTELNEGIRKTLSFTRSEVTVRPTAQRSQTPCELF